MCGIYGYIGRNAMTKVFQGLQSLEYRGYDSAGIALITKDFKYVGDNNENVGTYGTLVTIKAEGELDNLKLVLSGCKVSARIAIGHTRWATHGSPSVKNAHPQVSEDGDWALVHNGIIENSKELKKELPHINFKSETDTEVAVQLLQSLYNGDALSTVKTICEKLKGSFAFAIVTSHEPDKIFVARRGSPVAVGVSKEKSVVCSDLGSIGDMEEVYLLENDSFAVIKKGEVSLFDKDLLPLHLKNLVGFSMVKQTPLGKFKHYMKKEIHEAPLTILRTMEEYSIFDNLNKVLPVQLVKEIKNILLVGCGTAYHAGLIGKNLFEKLGIKSEAMIASEFRYGNFIANPNTLAIFVSQSGETADTIEAAIRCKRLGITTVAITNVKNSSITFTVDYCLYTNAGVEIGVASTKAYDCQLAMFYLLSGYFAAVRSKDKSKVSAVAEKIKSCAKIMQCSIDNMCRNIAKQISLSKSLYMLGRGQDYHIALEASLKLKEVSYIHSEAYPAGELKHGTISLIDKGTKVFAFITDENLKEKTLNNVSEVLCRGGEVILLSQFPIEANKGMKIIKLPMLDAEYMPLVVAGYMQRVAYYTSVLLGHNPDKPRSLAKSVTVE